jgi:hypothetical protein
MMRKDIRSQRKQFIAADLKLTDSEAEKFWPVFESLHVGPDLLCRGMQTGLDHIGRP